MTNLCLNSQCQNGGTCYSIANLSYMCVCPSGLKGAHCEHYTETRLCKLNLCRNGGTCTVEPSGLIQCLCPPGYLGNACEIDTAVCQKQTCSNRGVCQSQLNGDYSCLCDRKYSPSLAKSLRVFFLNIYFSEILRIYFGRFYINIKHKTSYRSLDCWIHDKIMYSAVVLNLIHASYLFS